MRNAIREYLGEIPQGWETRAIEFDGVHYGDVLLRGNEIHVAIFPELRRGHWSRRKVVAFIRALLEEKKFLTTRSVSGDGTEPFIRRLGFVLTNEDEHFRYWWCDAPPFEKGKSCTA